RCPLSVERSAPLAVSHMRTVSPKALASRDPSGENSTAPVALTELAFQLRIRRPEAGSQMRMIPSALLDASIRPSAENDIPRRGAPCGSAPTFRRPAKSHRPTVWSPDAEASNRPSGLNLSLFTYLW